MPAAGKRSPPHDERGEYSEFQAAGSAVNGAKSSCEQETPAHPGSHTHLPAVHSPASWQSRAVEHVAPPCGSGAPSSLLPSAIGKEPVRVMATTRVSACISLSRCASSSSGPSGGRKAGRRARRPAAQLWIAPPR